MLAEYLLLSALAVMLAVTLLVVAGLRAENLLLSALAVIVAAGIIAAIQEWRKK